MDMKTQPNDNTEPTGDHRSCEPRGGLTKREYFAALAMQGLLTSDEGGIPNLAKMAVECADVLINELNK